MLNVGDRVYHTGYKANGFIEAIDNNYQKDIYKVKFFWAYYCNNIPHGVWGGYDSTDRKWVMCRESSLIKTDMLSGPNKVTVFGKPPTRGRIMNVCEVPRRRRGDGSDIIIHYGGNVNRISSRSALILNKDIIYNKFHQAQLLGEDLSLKVTMDKPQDPENWIIKPFKSVGGRKIRHAEGDEAGYREYYQEFFPKVREYRAHCFLWEDNTVPLIQEKIVDNTNQLTWNKHTGGRFVFKYQDSIPGLEVNRELSESLINRMRAMSEVACKKLRIDFGGIDFGLDAEGNLKIFEVNSFMGIREQSMFTYKRVFNQLRNLDITSYIEKRFNLD